MSLKKGTPGKGGVQLRREQFSYTNPQCGLAKTWTGWLAADPYWCECHEHKPPRQIGTKPCCQWLTDGKVPCPWCKPGEPRKWIGYVHLYREVDRAPVLVLVHDSVADLLSGLTFGAHVLVGRVEGQSSAFVKPTESRLPWKSELGHRQRPIDTAASLLGIWNVPALCEWYLRGRHEISAEELDRYSAQGFKETLLRGERPTVGEYADLLLPGTVGDALAERNERFARQARKPSKNGKHNGPSEQ